MFLRARGEALSNRRPAVLTELGGLKVGSVSHRGCGAGAAPGAIYRRATSFGYGSADGAGGRWQTHVAKGFGVVEDTLDYISRSRR